MSAVRGERVRIGQADGTDIELVVFGDEDYSRYETPDGYPVVYDATTGLFWHARVVGGRYESTGVPASLSPPPGAVRHVEESAAVRSEKASARRAARGSR
jgi:hypothetical protein